MTEARLYHRDIGFPSQVAIPAGTMRVAYTKHAINAAQNDRYGAAQLPATIHYDVAQVFEVEISGNTCTKICVRLPYDDKRDLCVVLRGNLVVTVWFNRRNDSHKTLDASRYSKPNQYQ